MKRDRVILVVMDGLGLSQIPNNDSNAFYLARKPHLDQIFSSNPLCALQASGLAVGLPEGQMGNSEVGHQNLGAGRVVYQDITRIDLSIKTGEFARNTILQETLAYVNRKNVTLHLIGLISDGGVHSSLYHLEAIITAAKKQGVSRLVIHALMDGRDTAPHGGAAYLERLESFCEQTGLGKIATVIGRYYAMDRDNRWYRVQKAYQALVYGQGLKFPSAAAAIKSSYEREVTDEFVEPSIICAGDDPIATIKSGDAVIFFNFRADRAREITRALTQPNFSSFAVEPLNLHYVTMTQYHQDFSFPILFPPRKLTQILGEVISEAGMTQLRIAETEKYPHVTFFFNGGEEKVFRGEDRIMVPSPKVATYDLRPEMSLLEVTRRVVAAISEEKYNLIVLNFANPDMVGHSGILAAAIKAVEAVDNGVWQTLRAAFAHDYTMILTSDHGNCEMMIDPVDGSPFTAHTTNPVPCFVLDKHYRLKIRPQGSLCDVAPTILHILGMPQPAEMEGECLITCENCGP
ncbi:MAG: 2,3-bisphosphoglycerate-independent phosphoglycerate mutase [bacterium]|nr:2,3-bisphosphoglycerate-independent phosphoglycerate mutase [bacterium]